MRARTAALALAAAALLAAACGTTEKPGVAPSPPSTEATPGRPAVTDRATSTNDGAGCVVTLDPGADVGAAVASAEAGAVICLRAGRYEGALVVGRSVTLRGLGAPGEAVLDAAKGGPVVAVRDDDLEVRLEGLTLEGGSASGGGGGVQLTGMSTVRLVGCTLRDNVARQGPGGAVYADRGTVALERCRVDTNEATDAPGVFVDGIASLKVETSLIRGAGGPTDAVVRVRDGADAAIAHTTIVAEGEAAALHASGTSSRAPDVAVVDSVLAGKAALDVPGPFPGHVTVARSVLSAAAADAYSDLGGATVAAPGFAGEGAEPWAPGAGSAACGLAQGGGVDLAGKARPEDGACAGALER